MTNLERAKELQKNNGEKYDLLVKLYEMMSVGEVHFSYLKKDGEVRDAFGTIKTETLQEKNAMPKGTGKEPAGNVMSYYDLDSDGWRSFIADNLLEESMWK